MELAPLFDPPGKAPLMVKRRASAIFAPLSVLVAAVLLVGGTTSGAVGTQTTAGTAAKTRAAGPPARPTVPSTPSVGNYWGKKKGNTRTFRLTAEQLTQKIANFPVRTAQVWGYAAPGQDPSTPGPTLLAREGERIRFVVTNKLPEPTSVHPHGTHQPNSADGVAGIDFNPVQVGETRTYPAYKPGHAGTFAYHTHTTTATQETRGLAGQLIVLPKTVRASQNPDVDLAMTLQSFNVPGEGQLVETDPNERGMWPYNLINGKTGDASGGPITIRKGDLVQIRLYNASPMTHSMHLHGQDMKLVAVNGHRTEGKVVTTKAISPGEFFTLQFRANNPGNWVFHCSFAHHQANDGMSGYQGAPVGMTRIFHYAGAPEVPSQYYAFQG